MTFLAQPDVRDARFEPSTFGAGGAEPYAAALRNAENVLYLRRARSEPHAEPFPIDAGRWSADADATDLRLLAGLGQPASHGAGA